MKNPWLKIPFNDYENHMTSIGQLQVLNDIFKGALKKFEPELLTILGCTTGNGLEHVNPEITKTVHAVDINKSYLDITIKRFKKKIPGLQTYLVDLEKDMLNIPTADLVFVGLILEYVPPDILVPKIEKLSHAQSTVIVVIQKSMPNNPFVSKTNYNSIKELSKISREVAFELLNPCFTKNGFALVKNTSKLLKNGKEFIILNYKKEAI